MSYLEIIFWVLSLLVVHVYLGYPLLLAAIAALGRARPAITGSIEPRVTLLISAFNEVDVIARKLENSLMIDYPEHLLEIIVISDASDDGTDDVVKRYANRGIKLLRMPQRGGKTVGLNSAVEKASGEVIVFSDANAMYDRSAIRALVRHFADERVGAVVGESTYVDSSSGSDASESAYWRYETTIKRLESRIGYVVGGDGAIYAIRATNYRPMSPDALSDFVNPLQIAKQGFRCVYEPAAMSVEEAAGTFAKEFRRKVRIVNRAYRAVLSMPGLLNPLRYGFFSVELFSHKVLRWCVPFLLLLVLVVNVPLMHERALYRFTFVGQLVFYLLAIAGYVFRRRELPSFVYIPFYFCLVNIASAKGIIEAHRGKTYTTWATARVER